MRKPKQTKYFDRANGQAAATRALNTLRRLRGQMAADPGFWQGRADELTNVIDRLETEIGRVFREVPSYKLEGLFDEDYESAEYGEVFGR